ncbi:hypothetical protein FAI41_03515 [Acetobacteraceae bacterium]|nr:hypothetical protein FAI41_03515 [Acetobacteraceae bacterium]
MENHTHRVAQQAVKIFYKAPLGLVTGDFVEIGKIRLPTHMLTGGNVRRRSGLYFGWGAFWISLFLIYGILSFQDVSLWDFPFRLLSRPWDWFIFLIGVLAFIFALYFTLFPPFALYLEIEDDGDEKEILARTSLKPHELRKMAEAIEKAINWDYSPMKTF